MAHFEKKEWDQNVWKPEIAGVDFTERLHRFMGKVASDGTEIYTAWLITDDESEIQITPDSARVFLSLIDDDSDTITVLDPSDGLWFQFMRQTHPESFQSVLQLVAPWAQTTTGLTPTPEVYGRFLKAVSSDTDEDDFHVPDDWI